MPRKTRPVTEPLLHSPKVKGDVLRVMARLHCRYKPCRKSISFAARPWETTGWILNRDFLTCGKTIVLSTIQSTRIHCVCFALSTPIPITKFWNFYFIICTWDLFNPVRKPVLYFLFLLDERPNPLSSVCLLLLFYSFSLSITPPLVFHFI